MLRPASSLAQAIVPRDTNSRSGELCGRGRGGHVLGNEVLARDGDEEGSMAFILAGVQVGLHFGLKQVFEMGREAIAPTSRRE